jgi:hypothetical protein
VGRGEASEMSRGGTKQQELARKAHTHFLAEGRAREAEHRIKNEERRHDEMVAKTTRLRELRLAREAALREAKAKVKPRLSRT